MTDVKVTMMDDKGVVEEFSGIEEEVAAMEQEQPETDQPVDIADLDPDEELWPNGPTVSYVLDLKEQFGNVYATSFTEGYILWRIMKRSEYRQMIKDMEQMAATGEYSEVDIKMINEEYVFGLCLLYPQFTKEELEELPAGFPSTISQNVMEASGFVSIDVRVL